MDPARVLITGYPDPARAGDGMICGSGRRKKMLAEAPGVPTLREINGREAKWASETVLAKLNKALRAQRSATVGRTSASTSALAQARRLRERSLPVG